MKDKSEFTRIACGLALAFGLPWLLLVVVPYVKLSAIEPKMYDESGAVVEEDAFLAAELGTVYSIFPGKAVGGNVATGERLYDSLGCAYCHTQMVRPTYAGADMWRGWGGEKSSGQARETRPADYYGDTRAMLGYLRIGPDLSNVGSRNMDRAWHLQHLYSPRSVVRESVMPGYESLFEVRDIVGQPSEDALDLREKFAPEAGHEIVPTSDAHALVDYLLSRKKNAPIPGSGSDSGSDSDGAGSASEVAADGAEAPAAP